MLAAARNTDIDEVLRILHLEPGQLAAIVNVAIPPPAPPLPADQATTFPDDDDDAAVSEAGPYLTRQRLVLLRHVPEPVAARLAALMPGQAGVILFAIARGDAIDDIAAMLKVSVEEIDTVLRDLSGQHLTRPDW